MKRVYREYLLATSSNTRRKGHQMKPLGSEHQNKVDPHEQVFMEWLWSDMKIFQKIPRVRKKKISYSYPATHTRIYLKKITREALFLKHDLELHRLMIIFLLLLCDLKTMFLSNFVLYCNVWEISASCDLLCRVTSDFL